MKNLNSASFFYFLMVNLYMRDVKTGKKIHIIEEFNVHAASTFCVKGNGLKSPTHTDSYICFTCVVFSVVLLTLISLYMLLNII